MIYVYSSVNLIGGPEFGLCSILGYGPQIQGYSESYNIVTLASFLHCLSISLKNVSWFNILETDEYLVKSFNTNLSALLWAISSLEILCFIDRDHTGEVYSRTDLTIDM